ncbi:MAG: hypothetical protein C0467_16995 [Planctomycetaceae bacterium]|nr:hypothetical protein [Planctomycetaceae bacterium]
MTDEEALRRSIIAQPEEDTPRMVYADWLQENDRCEEAEFIRVGCRLEATSPDHPDYPEWLARQDELTIWLATHVDAPKLKFADGLEGSGEAGWWRITRRGFPRYVDFDGNHHHGAKAMRALAASVEKAFETLPTRWLAVRSITNEQLAELLRQPVIAKLDRLTVQLYAQAEANDDAARLIADCPHLRNLRGAALAFNFGDAGVAALSGSENLRRLEWLSIPGEGLTAAAVRSLGSAEWFRNLRSLDLCEGVSESAFGELCRVGPLAGLHTLKLASSRLSLDSCEAFALSKSFPVLSQLELARTYLGGGLMEVLASASWLRPAYLALDNCGMWNDGIAAIADAPWLGSVRWLALRGNQFSADGVAALASSPNLTGLKHLDLSNNSVGAGGLRAIASNPALRGLIGLNLAGRKQDRGRLTPGHLLAFLSKLDAPQLRYLSLRGRPVGAIAARSLANEKFASLTRLDLTNCGLTPGSVKTLLKSPAMQNLVELRLEDNKLKTGLELLTDPQTLPRLGGCYLDGNAIETELETKLRKRAGVVF